jgi:hypothetical protein
VSSIESRIRELAPDGLMVNIWPRAGGGYQVNVGESVGGGWTVVMDDDPVAGLAEAMRQRACGVATREVISSAEMQIDLEEAIAAAPRRDVLDIAGLLG